MKLTAPKVMAILVDCLFNENENDKDKPPENAVIVKGLVRSFGFHPGRLESHRDEVKELLAELPDNFQEDKGGGWSFLNACMTKDGEQWGEHIDMEALFCLGIGLGLAKWQMLAMKEVMPGGMPYVVVLNDQPKEA